jgi:amino acid transporter
MAAQDVIPEGTFESSDRNLRRQMGFIPLLFISLAALIGSGWLFAAISATGYAGPAAIVSWVIAAALVIIIALTYAEVAGMLPRSGAISRYPNLTHGAYTGWMLGWVYFIACVTVPAIEAEAVVTYIGGTWPFLKWTHTSHGVAGVMVWPDGVLVAFGLMVLFFIVNYLGIKLLSEVNRWVTLWKLIIPTITAIFLFTVLHGSNFGSYKGGFLPNGPSSIFAAISGAGILFALLGFRQALDFAGEAKNPQKHVPLATILSVCIAAGIYILVQIVFIGAVRWGNAGVHPGDWSGLAASAWSASPLVDATRAAGVGWLASYAWVLIADSWISPSGTGWVYMGATTRNTYGISVHGFLPKLLQRPNRFGIPWVSAIVAGVVGLVFMIPAPSWYKMVGIITAATALTYVLGGVAVPVLRKHAPDLPRPFRLRWMWLWAPLSYVASALIVYWGGYGTITDLYAVAFLGLPIFVWYYAPLHGWFSSAMSNAVAAGAGLVYLGAWIYIQIMGGWALRIAPPASGSWGFIVYFVAMTADIAFFTGVVWLLAHPKGRRHVQSSLWLIVLLLALQPVSYYGAYGPEAASTTAPHAKPAIHFPYDILIAIAISLVTWAWAVVSGFNTPDLQDITSQAAAAGPVSAGEPVTP